MRERIKKFAETAWVKISESASTSVMFTVLYVLQLVIKQSIKMYLQQFY